MYHVHVSRCTALPCTTVCQSAITPNLSPSPGVCRADRERPENVYVHFDSQNDFTNNCHAAEDEIVALIHWKTKPFPSAAYVAAADVDNDDFEQFTFFCGRVRSIYECNNNAWRKKIVYYLSAVLKSRKSSMNRTVTPAELEIGKSVMAP